MADDYEILCGVAPDQRGGLRGAARRAGIPVACLTQAAAGREPIRVVDDAGGLLEFGSGKFSHF